MEAIAWWLWSLALVPYTLFPLVVRAVGRDRRALEVPPSNENWPSVVVVFAAYNEEAVLAAKLDSLLSQDYPGNLEVWVGSDLSSDQTDAILA